MPTNTPNGFPYPTSSEPVANGASNIQSLATTVDYKMGLYKIIPTGATNATVSGDGDVTVGAGVNTVSVAGAFSSLFDNYRIIYTGGAASVDTGINFQLSGSSANYCNALLYILYASAGANTLVYNGASSWVYAGSMSTNQNPFMDIDVFEPFAARSTRFSQRWAQFDSAGVNNGVHKQNTSFTGFTLVTQIGNLTGGTIRVYGYRN